VDEHTLLLYAALAASGIAAGFLNTIAGGGSMFTLPVLMLLGMPANDANGTNRLSVIGTSLSGMSGFHRGGALDVRAIAPVIAPTVLGSFAGAVVAAIVPPATLKYVLLGTMLAVATLMAIRPNVVTAPEGSEPQWSEKRVAGFFGLFGAGVYGGFIQAGVGFVLLSVLGGVLRYDLVRANALKLVCTLVFGAVALGVFVVAGQVVWIPAVVLTVFTIIGAQLAVRFALRTHHEVLRWVVFVAVVATCVGAMLKA